jgi:hypothetical protein
MLAASKKLPPISREREIIETLTSSGAPNPHSSPNVIVPKQSGETRRPDRPSVM